MQRTYDRKTAGASGPVPPKLTILKKKLQAVKRRKKAEDAGRVLLEAQSQVETTWETAVVMAEHLQHG